MESIPRASLHDVARAAGVSLATVDRVLHGRAGVRARTVERVNAVVERLGYRPDPAAARLARKRHARLAVVLPSGTNSFVDDARPAGAGGGAVAGRTAGRRGGADGRRLLAAGAGAATCWRSTTASTR